MAETLQLQLLLDQISPVFDSINNKQVFNDYLVTFQPMYLSQKDLILLLQAMKEFSIHVEVKQ